MATLTKDKMPNSHKSNQFFDNLYPRILKKCKKELRKETLLPGTS